MPADDTRNRRQEASKLRRQAILDAALDLFAANGFAATRLDEVAEKAGVAKGTIYLFFKDKEDLFQQIVIGAVSPILASLSVDAVARGQSFDVVLTHLIEVFRRDILASKRKEIIRLVIVEGARFPRIAEFYHREVIAKGCAIIRAMVDRSFPESDPRREPLMRYPQLAFAPMLLAVIWDGVFANIEPLDVGGLLTAHRTLLLGADTEERTS